MDEFIVTIIATNTMHAFILTPSRPFIRIVATLLTWGLTLRWRERWFALFLWCRRANVVVNNMRRTGFSTIRGRLDIGLALIWLKKGVSLMGARRGNAAETQVGSRLRKGQKLASQAVFPQTKGEMGVARKGRRLPWF